MRSWFVLVALIVGLALFAPASWPGRADATANDVIRAELARTKALEGDDLVALDKILGEDLRYVHASGKVDTKATLIEAIRSGDVHYISWQAKRLNARVLGDVAVLDGEYRVRVTDHRVQPDPLDVNILILAVYALRNGTWQQIAWQSTRDVTPSTTNH